MTSKQLLTLGALALSPLAPGFQPLSAQEQPIATFRSSVAVVRLSAVVRDRKGRFVQNLGARDFEILDSGQPRPIAEFRRDTGGISVALLVDASGSMEARLADAHEAATHLLAWLDRDEDEAAVFAFDTAVRQVSPFMPGLRTLPSRLAAMTPFGATALHDAIDEAASHLAAREGLHRAVVVFTDGIDNASQLDPEQVYKAASAVDVPVYIVGVVSPGDVRRRAGAQEPLPGSLADFAARTGGQAFVAGTPADRSAVARRIVDDLRHQYLMAFESSPRPGWHPLVIRTHAKGLTIRARSGYVVGQSRPAF